MEIRISNKLDQMLKYVHLNVPFYKNIIDNLARRNSYINGYELLQAMPVIKKKDFVEYKNEMLSEEYDPDKLIVEKTSGSSGTPFLIYKTEIDRIRQLKESWKFRYKHYGIRSNDPFCRFSYSKDIADDNHTFRQRNTLYLSALEMTPQIMDEFTEAINEFRPKWFFTTPSTLYYYLNYLKNNAHSFPLRHHFNFIELTGEKVFPNIKYDVENYFNCPVGNNYGTTETYAIAMACKYNTLHVMENNVWVEMLDDDFNPVMGDEKEGNIVITSYNNTAMPFIRYYLGDRGTYLSYFKCPCGEHGSVLKLNDVRFTEDVKLRDNRFLSPVIFCILTEEISSRYNYAISQFKVTQESYDSFKMWIVLNNSDSKEKITSEVHKSIITYLKKNVSNDVMLTIEEKSESSLMPNQATGKLTYFTSFIYEEKTYEK